MKSRLKHKFGQYFTPEIVADFMIGLSNILRDSLILEPSCGKGVFLNLLQKKGFNNICAYEIDKDLAKGFKCVKYESFVSAQVNKRFDLIIGNPPYIRWKNLEEELKQELSVNILWNKYCNSLCDYLYIFILKSIELLKDGGQLIFICPEYWLNTTHSIALRNYMIQNGYFEQIYHFNETPIFDKVTVSTIIFKYIKGQRKQDTIKVTKYYAQQKLTKEVLQKLKRQEACNAAEYLCVPQFQQNQRWLLQSEETIDELNKFELACKKENKPKSLFSEDVLQFSTIGEYCDIGNGMVSGLDKAFQWNGDTLNQQEMSAIIQVVKAKDIKPYHAEAITKYIYIDRVIQENEFKEIYPNFYNHFQPYKDALLNRYQYNRKINYWEWVFLRNFNLFNKKEARIFVPCKERISNKKHFRFALINDTIFPTQDVTAIFKKSKTKESMEYIVSYLNTPIVFDWLRNNGIVKGNIVEFSEAPIASVPFRPIDWNNEKEINMHNEICALTKTYMQNKDVSLIEKINNKFQILLQAV